MGKVVNVTGGGRGKGRATVLAAARKANADPGRLTEVAALIPMRRVGQPVEVANATMWLTSEEASFVTGAVVPVAGGR